MDTYNLHNYNDLYNYNYYNPNCGYDITKYSVQYIDNNIPVISSKQTDPYNKFYFDNLNCTIQRYLG